MRDLTTRKSSQNKSLELFGAVFYFSGDGTRVRLRHTAIVSVRILFERLCLNA
jgi:hypothetical protein